MEHWKLATWCEIDKFASASYCAIHGVDADTNLGDITKVNPDDIPDFDLMTWGFPCTDISCAGHQKGFVDADGNLTRSGLYYEGMRILLAKKPKVSIIENVKALTQKKFQKEFQTILSDLDRGGVQLILESPKRQGLRDSAEQGARFHSVHSEGCGQREISLSGTYSSDPFFC